MQNKIMLFDTNGVQVGETFIRRAKQLVSQQRAEWLNERAIRFTSEAQTDETEIFTEEFTEDHTTTTRSTGHEALLYHLAEEKIRKRKNFIWHSLFMLPVYFCIAVLSSMIGGRGGSDFAFLMSGLWWSPYFVHTYLFFRTKFKEYRPEDRAMQVEREVDKLRRQWSA